MSKKIDKRVTMIVATVCNCVAFTLVGPSGLLNYPDSLALMCVGQALVGMAFGAMYIPTLPEMVESAGARFPGQEREVNNMSAGIFQSFLGMGFLIAPLYGSILHQLIGFRLLEDITATLNLAMAVIYFALGGGVAAFKSTYRNFSESKVEEIPTVPAK